MRAWVQWSHCSITILLLTEVCLKQVLSLPMSVHEAKPRLPLQKVEKVAQPSTHPCERVAETKNISLIMPIFHCQTMPGWSTAHSEVLCIDDPFPVLLIWFSLHSTKPKRLTSAPNKFPCDMDTLSRCCTLSPTGFSILSTSGEGTINLHPSSGSSQQTC